MKNISNIFFHEFHTTFVNQAMFERTGTNPKVEWICTCSFKPNPKENCTVFFSIEANKVLFLQGRTGSANTEGAAEGIFEIEICGLAFIEKSDSGSSYVDLKANNL